MSFRCRFWKGNQAVATLLLSTHTRISWVSRTPSQPSDERVLSYNAGRLCSLSKRFQQLFCCSRPACLPVSWRASAPTAFTCCTLLAQASTMPPAWRVCARRLRRTAPARPPCADARALLLSKVDPHERRRRRKRSNATARQAPCNSRLFEASLKHGACAVDVPAGERDDNSGNFVQGTQPVPEDVRCVRVSRAGC